MVDKSLIGHPAFWNALGDALELTTEESAREMVPFGYYADIVEYDLNRKSRKAVRRKKAAAHKKNTERLYKSICDDLDPKRHMTRDDLNFSNHKRTNEGWLLYWKESPKRPTILDSIDDQLDEYYDQTEYNVWLKHREEELIEEFHELVEKWLLTHE